MKITSMARPDTHRIMAVFVPRIGLSLNLASEYGIMTVIEN